MRNTVIKIILAAAAFTVTSCNNEKPESIATDFLRAYFATEYEKAAQLCREPLSSSLIQSLDEAQLLDSTTKAKIILHTRYYEPVVTSTQPSANGDSITVYYNIVNRTTPETPAEEGAEPLQAQESIVAEKQLTITREEDGWRVASLN